VCRIVIETATVKYARLTIVTTTGEIQTWRTASLACQEKKEKKKKKKKKEKKKNKKKKKKNKYLINF
jgi:hypothetical protein